MSLKKIKQDRLGYHQVHYFHNGGKFDFEFILAFFQDNKNYHKTLDKEVNEEEREYNTLYYSVIWSDTFRMITLFKYIKERDRYRKVTIEFRDSRYVFRNSVKELGNTIEKMGINLKKGDYKKACLRAEQGATTEELKNDKELNMYCMNDSLIVCVMFEQMSSKFPTSSNLPNTTPGWAVSIYLHDITINKPEDKGAKAYFRETIMELEKEVQEKYNMELNSWYTGGLSTYRQASLMKVTKNVFHEDVVSQYPHKMKCFLIPIGEAKVIENEEEWETYKAKNLNDLESGKYVAFIHYTYHDIKQSLKVPNMLKRNKQAKARIEKGELGSYETHQLEVEEKECYLFYKEFEKLVKYKDRIFNKVYVYEKTKNIFEDYVDKFYTMKAEAKKNKDTANTIFSKLMLNALYGKTGERSRKEEKIFIEMLEDLKEKLEDKLISTSEKEDMLGMIAIIKEVAPPFSYLQIATYITSLSRYWLLKRWNEILALGGVVLYCDTDSNFFTIPKKNKDKLEYGSNLGQWELDKEVIDNFFILAPKAYCGWNKKQEVVVLATKGVDKKVVLEAINKNGIKHFTTNQPYNILDSKRVKGGIVLFEKQKTIMTNEKYQMISQSIS